MSEKPAWLPDMLSIGGEPSEIFKMLYQVFCRDFKDSPCLFRTCPVWYDRRKIDGEYEEGFWHLITREDEETGERLLDTRRAERLPWCGPSIRNSFDPILKVWNYLEGKNRINTYIWLEKFDYVIILQKKEHRIGTVYFMVTAYYIDGSRTKKQLQNKFGNKLV